MGISIKIRSLLLGIGLISIILAPSSLMAQERSVTSGEARTVLNTLKYIRGIERKQGEVMIGVLFSEDIPGSEVLARRAAQELESQKNILKKIKVRAVKASLRSFQQGLPPDILIVPSLMAGSYPRIKEVSLKNKVITISLDSACVREQVCAIGIESGGSTEIYLNEKVLSESGYDVDAAFKYMAIRL